MIQFLVTGQMLQIVTPVIASASHNYITAELTINSNDWDNTYKWAHFTLDDKTYHVPFYNNKINASQQLDLTAGTWKVYLTGNELIDNVSVTRITTNTAYLYVDAVESDSPFPHITPEFEEVLAAQIAEALEIANDVKDAADAGEFNGATFLPDVNENGIISWTNDKGLVNPESRDITGPKGDPGTTFNIKGFYPSYEAMVADVTDPAANDCYGVGTESPYTFYAWDSTNEEWVDIGQVLGAAAGFGSVYAYIDSNYGTPSVNVTTSGPDTAKVFTFYFHNLKGYTPEKGTDYFTEADKAELVEALALSINISQIGGIENPASKNTGDFLKWNGEEWVAAVPPYPVTSVNGDTGAVNTRLKFTNVSVAASDFTLQPTPIYEDFPYVATVDLEGVTSAMIPEVIFDSPDATSGLFASVAESFEGYIMLFAADEPEADITIPTILCWR